MRRRPVVDLRGLHDGCRRERISERRPRHLPAFNALAPWFRCRRLCYPTTRYGRYDLRRPPPTSGHRRRPPVIGGLPCCAPREPIYGQNDGECDRRGCRRQAAILRAVRRVYVGNWREHGLKPLTASVRRERDRNQDDLPGSNSSPASLKTGSRRQLAGTRHGDQHRRSPGRTTRRSTTCLPKTNSSPAWRLKTGPHRQLAGTLLRGRHGVSTARTES